MKIATITGSLFCAFGLSLFVAAGCAPSPESDSEDEASIEDEMTEEEMGDEDVSEAEQAITCSIGCGEVLTTFEEQNVYSNSPEQGTGNDCQPGTSFQCVEFARRYWDKVKHHSFPWVGAAYELCKSEYTGAGYNYSKHVPGNGFKPKRGDLFVMGKSLSRPYGHVGVVDTVSGTLNDWDVKVVEQNASCSGRKTYDFMKAKCYLRPY